MEEAKEEKGKGVENAETHAATEESAPEEATAEEATASDETAAASESVAEPTDDVAEGDAESAEGDDVPGEGEAEGDAEAPAEDDRYSWFVIHTYSGHEERAAQNIERAVKQAKLQERVPRVLVPMESVAEMKNGKKTITDKKFFPSYVLVQMEMNDETWQVVSNTPGVTRFVGTGAKPQPISNDEIDRILGRIEGTKEKPTPTIPYHVGEHVRVTDGPFSDFTGVVDEVNPERGKLKVMVSIFGRATPVELDFLQVESL